MAFDLQQFLGSVSPQFTEQFKPKSATSDNAWWGAIGSPNSNREAATRKLLDPLWKQSGGDINKFHQLVKNAGGQTFLASTNSWGVDSNGNYTYRRNDPGKKSFIGKVADTVMSPVQRAGSSVKRGLDKYTEDAIKLATVAGLGYGAYSGLSSLGTGSSSAGMGTSAGMQGPSAELALEGAAKTANYGSLVNPTTTGIGGTGLTAPAGGLGAAGGTAPGVANLTLANLGAVPASSSFMPTTSGLAKIFGVGSEIANVYSSYQNAQYYKELEEAARGNTQLSAEAAAKLRELEANPEAWLNSPEVMAVRERALDAVRTAASVNGTRMGSGMLEDLLNTSREIDYNALGARRAELMGRAFQPNQTLANIGVGQQANASDRNLIGAGISLGKEVFGNKILGSENPSLSDLYRNW